MHPKNLVLHDGRPSSQQSSTYTLWAGVLYCLLKHAIWTDWILYLRPLKWGSWRSAAASSLLYFPACLCESAHWALFPNEQAQSAGQLDQTVPIHHLDMQYRITEPNLPTASKNCAYFKWQRVWVITRQ